MLFQEPHITNPDTAAALSGSLIHSRTSTNLTGLRLSIGVQIIFHAFVNIYVSPDIYTKEHFMNTRRPSTTREWITMWFTKYINKLPKIYAREIFIF